MKLGTIFSKVSNVIHYLLSGRKRKLYKQWVEMAELPLEDIPLEEVGSRVIREEEEEERDETQLRLTTLFMMQGATLVLLCAILILLIIQSC